MVSTHNQKASKTGSSSSRRLEFLSSQDKSRKVLSISNNLLQNAIPLAAGNFSRCIGSVGRTSTNFRRRCALSYFSNKAHARRKFNEALAGTGAKKTDSPEAIGFAYCNQLFAVEKKAEQMTAEERHELREKEAKPVVEAFYQWVEACWANTLPQSLLGKALTYVQNQKKYLLAFFADGRIELSNNRAERSIKPFVIGRRMAILQYTRRSKIICRYIQPSSHGLRD
jgi:hypothetical protein